MFADNDILYTFSLAFVIFLVILLIIYFHIDEYIIMVVWPEHFTSEREKATAIRDWFARNPNAKYVDYSRDLPNSDIVEYTAAKNKYLI